MRAVAGQTAHQRGAQRPVRSRQKPALYYRMSDGISARVPYEKAARTLGDPITARDWSAMQKLLVRQESMA